MNRLLLVCVLVLGLVAASCSEQAATPADPDPGRDSGLDSGRGRVVAGGPDILVPGDLAFDQPGFDLELLRLSLRRSPSRLPQELLLSDQAAMIVADLLYDGLTEATGLEEHLRPALATDWSSNDDFTEWVFSLDLRRMDAPQVAAHFELLLAEVDNPAVTPLLGDVVAVEATSAGKVRFVLSRPSAGFPWLVSGVGLSVVGLDGAPTGRYVIEADDEEMLVLVPDLDAAKVLPTVEVAWAATDEDAYDALTLGLADAAVAPAGSLEDARRRFGSVPAARLISRFYGINLESPKLADERVREALIHAVDRDGLMEGDGVAPAFSVDGLLPPSVAGYDPGGCNELCAYEPEVAAALMRDVAVDSEAEPVVLTVAFSGQEQELVAATMAADLEVAGFQVELRALSAEELSETIAVGGAELFAFGWLAGAGSLDAIVPQLLASDSPTNSLGFSSATVDQLIADAAGSADDDARWSLLAEAHALAMQEGRVMPLSVAKSQLVLAPPVADLIVRADGTLDIEASQ